jgi:general secretion pathway protein D
MSLSAPVAMSQGPGGDSYVINLRDAEIQSLADQVSTITGRTLILDPAVSGQVTVISAEPLNQAGVWELFQSVLRVHGYAALRTGDIWRIVPQAAITQGGAPIDIGGTLQSQDFITRLVQLENLPSGEALRVLRPLVASFGYIEALPNPNAIVVTDSAENVRRVEELALLLDQGGGSKTATISFQNAGAGDAAQAIEDLIGTSGNANQGPRLAVDERSNILLVRGSPSEIAEIQSLARTLDRPGSGSSATAPTTRVFRLRHSDAEAITTILRGVIGTSAPVDNPVARSLAQRRPARETATSVDQGTSNTLAQAVADASGQSNRSFRSSAGLDNFGASDANAGEGGFSTGDIAIQAAPSMNAVIVRGPPALLAEVDALIAELDMRRPQVLIEAAIVEITGDTAEQLGIQFGMGQAAPEGGIVATSFSGAGPSLRSILSILGVPASVALAGEGITAGISAGDEFGILIQALAQSSKANLLSTPRLTTLDNQAAQIVVGQNVPFRTGRLATDGNTVNPFTTIERPDVCITMQVILQINQVDVVKLEISQEISSLANVNVAGAADLITNRRSIQTTVLADNGETIMLGGLITDDRQSSESQVPVLGDIPGLGKLFGSELQSRRKQTLFIYLRPTILRARADVARQSQSSFERVRAAETEPVSRGSLLFGAQVKKLPLEVEGLY